MGTIAIEREKKNGKISTKSDSTVIWFELEEMQKLNEKSATY